MAAHLAVVCDMREENWPSMNLVGEMLLRHLKSDHAEQVYAEEICPTMRRRFTKEGRVAGRLFNADRLLNRFWEYPRMLRREVEKFDLFHLVDHSYSQLIHYLPPERTVVTCHDMDTFRCILHPEREQRSAPFRAMTRRIMTGLAKAARVTCDSEATREELLASGLVVAEHVTVVRNGVHPAFSSKADPFSDIEIARILGPANPEAVDILHVGSTIRRKRVDVLLRLFARVLNEFPEARLLRVGGNFTPEQLRLIEKLKLKASIIVLPPLRRPLLAAVYRRATMLLQTSESEGFGLPVIESLACGTPVLASELKVLGEVGGDAAAFCPVGDVSAWATNVNEMLAERNHHPLTWEARKARGLAQAAKFSWSEYAKKMISIYLELI